MKVKSENKVAQLCPTFHDPMDYSLPGSSVQGVFQARVLEWGAIAFSIVSIINVCVFASMHSYTDTLVHTKWYFLVLLIFTFLMAKDDMTFNWLLM